MGWLNRAVRPEFWKVMENVCRKRGMVGVSGKALCNDDEFRKHKGEKHLTQKSRSSFLGLEYEITRQTSAIPGIHWRGPQRS